jgi:hypothetical protein
MYETLFVDEVLLVNAKTPKFLIFKNYMTNNKTIKREEKRQPALYACPVDCKLRYFHQQSISRPSLLTQQVTPIRESFHLTTSANSIMENVQIDTYYDVLR